MLTLLQLLVTATLASFAIGAPTNSSTATQKSSLPWNWAHIAEDDKSLQRFRGTLLNETALPFLKNCLETDCCKRSDQRLCPIYYDTVRQLNDAHPSMNLSFADLESRLKNVSGNVCRGKLAQLHPKYYLNEDNTSNNDIGCGDWCFDDKMVRTPICSVLVVMGELLFTTSSDVNQTKVEVAPHAGSAAAAETKKEELKVADGQPKAPNKVDTPRLKSPEFPQVPKSELEKSPLKSTLPESAPDNDDVAAKSALVKSPAKSPLPESAPANDDVAAEKAEENKPVVVPPALPPKEDASGIDGDGVDSKGEDRDDVYDYRLDGKSKGSTIDVMKAGRDMVSKEKNPPPLIQSADIMYEETQSNFLTYFLFGMVVCIVFYVVYHNKSKILGLVLEGRRGNKGRGTGRRKHTAAYRKLDSNLEEAITSSTSNRSSQIIY